MAQHEIDWSKFTIPVEGTPVDWKSHFSSLPEATITIDGIVADWPIGETVAIDWYGDGRPVDAVVTGTGTNADGEHVWHLKVV